mmetsp:Transcript_11265/g.27721  ORF Transcript_11265/g.27721 Transcript_11265/m.27721 type:complete len:644 (-) Transcript_11265:313-2244(-)
MTLIEGQEFVPLIAARRRMSATKKRCIALIGIFACFCVATTVIVTPGRRRTPPPSILTLGNPKVFFGRAARRVKTFFVWQNTAEAGASTTTATSNAPNSRTGQHTQKQAALVATEPLLLPSSPLEKLQAQRETKEKPEDQSNIEYLLQELPNHQVFRNFVEIMQIPRESFKEVGIRDWAMAKGIELGCEVRRDAAGNLLIQRRATPGYEDRPKIAIQAHMDMVCERAKGKIINFATDPITGVVEGDWLQGDGTTLGADNGIGVAAALAILAEPLLPAGQIEVLLTVGEEKDMVGASQIDANLMDSDIMINVDSESENEICAGSAGGFGKIIQGTVETRSPKKTEVGLDVRIGNLAGGHTGVDIHEGRANAIILWARLIEELENARISYRISSLKGGTAHNAIPRTLSSVLLIQKDQEEEARKILQENFEIINQEYEGFESRVWTLEMHRTDAVTALTGAESRRVKDIVLEIPDGVDRFNGGSVQGVETSSTLSLASINAAKLKFTLQMFVRSSKPSRLKYLNGKLNAIARNGGAEASGQLRLFPGWSPRPNSAVLHQAVDSHKKLFNRSPKIFSVHAGLECGVIAQKYPRLDTVSIGPTIENAHTPEERLKISSVVPFYDWLRQIIVDVAEGGYSRTVFQDVK